MSVEQRPTLRRVLGLAAVWAAVSAAALLSPGCYGRNCEGSFEVFGSEPGQGRMIDESTWRSNADEEEWLPLPRQRYYHFDLRALGGRTPYLVVPYVSPSPNPMRDDMDFTLGSGNLVKIRNKLPNRVDIYNDTCSDFYLQLIVTAQPFPPSAAADAGANDAPGALDPAGDGGDADDDPIP